MKTKQAMHWTEMDSLLSGLLESAANDEANLEALDKISRGVRARTGVWTTKIRYASARNEKPEIAALK
jgi:hypothetical protein